LGTFSQSCDTYNRGGFTTHTLISVFLYLCVYVLMYLYVFVCVSEPVYSLCTYINSITHFWSEGVANMEVNTTRNDSFVSHPRFNLPPQKKTSIDHQNPHFRTPSSPTPPETDTREDPTHQKPDEVTVEPQGSSRCRPSGFF
jgi:hypothetical protein